MISIILGTARNSFPIIDLPDVHIFQPTLDSLQRQNFKDIEFIVSDCRFEKRPDCFEGKPFKRSDYDFQIKHIPVKPNYWLEHGMWTGPSVWNKGIIEAEGELIVFMDDCSSYPKNDALDIYWEWYQKGYFASALCLYNKGGKPLYHGEEAKKAMAMSQPKAWKNSAKNLDILFKLGERVKDSRWRYIGGNGIYFFPGQMYFAYSSCSLESILRVNGWDSNFDGDKVLADCDFGIRLEQIGCKFVVDKRLTVIENVHTAIPKDTLFYEGEPPRSNYELMRMNQAKKRWRANGYTLTPEEIEHLRVYRHLGYGGHGKDMVPPIEKGTVAYEHFLYWVNHPPIFSLRELRTLK